MLEVKDLTFQWIGGPITNYPDFRVSSGQIVLLLGSSGSGKTTLLHLIGGLLRPLSGSVKLNQTEMTTLTSAKLDQFRGKNIGFIFQKHYLQESLTVRQNLQMPVWLSGRAVSLRQVDELLEMTGLSGKGDRNVQELSHGQQQRVAIGRAMIHKPSLILADEPTSALDDVHCTATITLMRDLARQSGSALLVATHDHRLKALANDMITL